MFYVQVEVAWREWFGVGNAYGGNAAHPLRPLEIVSSASTTRDFFLDLGNI